MFKTIATKCLLNSSRTGGSVIGGLPAAAWGSYGSVVARDSAAGVDATVVRYSGGPPKSQITVRYYSSSPLTTVHPHRLMPVTVNILPASRWTSTTSQTPSSAGDGSGDLQSNPAPHFRTRKNLEAQKDESKKAGQDHTLDASKPGEEKDNYLLPHPIWSEQEMDAVSVTHKEPDSRVDKAAYLTCRFFRRNFDFFSGFTWGKRTERKWLHRIIFLETVAGVPGMVAAMCRHLRSLRRMQRDHGWIHTLLEEAENERMHLMTAMEIRQTSLFFRLMVLGAQGIFVNMFFIAYLISPRFCHRFVGYLEEEAVITYTKLLKDIDDGALPKWINKPAPEIAVNYWKLGPDADFRDMFRAIRADEAHHREVNHKLSDIKPDDTNPFGPGQ